MSPLLLRVLWRCSVVARRGSRAAFARVRPGPWTCGCCRAQAFVGVCAGVRGAGAQAVHKGWARVRMGARCSQMSTGFKAGRCPSCRPFFVDSCFVVSQALVVRCHVLGRWFWCSALSSCIARCSSCGAPHEPRRAGAARSRSPTTTLAPVARASRTPQAPRATDATASVMAAVMVVTAIGWGACGSCDLLGVHAETPRPASNVSSAGWAAQWWA